MQRLAFSVFITKNFTVILSAAVKMFITLKCSQILYVCEVPIKTKIYYL